MSTGLRMLGDRILVRPLTYEHAILFVAGIELRKGEVLAVGPGRRVKRRIPWMMPAEANPFDRGRTVNPGQTFYVEDGAETGEIRKVPVNVGDIIEFGFRDVFGFYHAGEKLLVVRAQNVYGTTTGDRAEGILEPASAPID